MKLSEWRKASGKTLKEVGEALGFTHSNPSRAAQRIERGEVNVDADMAERIAELTGDAVRPPDIHETRLEFLRARLRSQEVETPTEAAQ